MAAQGKFQEFQPLEEESLRQPQRDSQARVGTRYPGQGLRDICRLGTSADIDRAATFSDVMRATSEVSSS